MWVTIMNEYSLSEVLEEVHGLEFSRRHKRAMKKIFALYSKNIESKQAYHLRLKKRLVFACAVIFAAMLFTGAAVVYRSSNFSGVVYSDNLHLFAGNVEGNPDTIEQRYSLTAVPSDYKLVDYLYLNDWVFECYKNESTGSFIWFYQYVKSTLVIYLEQLLSYSFLAEMYFAVFAMSIVIGWGVLICVSLFQKGDE